MQRIPLTRNTYALVDDADFESLSAYQWQLITPGGPQGRRYAVRYKGNRAIYMHRELLKDQLSDERPHADHINGNGLDNRRQNLRPCSRSENQRNRAKLKRNGRTTSEFKGVSRTRTGWAAKITVAPCRQKHVGSFDSELEAAKAYDQAALSYHGEFARLNFSSEAR